MDRDTAEKTKGATKDTDGKVSDDKKLQTPQKGIAAIGKGSGPTGFGLAALTNRIKKIKNRRRRA